MTFSIFTIMITFQLLLNVWWHNFLIVPQWNFKETISHNFLLSLVKLSKCHELYLFDGLLLWQSPRDCSFKQRLSTLLPVSYSFRGVRWSRQPLSINMNLKFELDLLLVNRLWMLVTALAVFVTNKLLSSWFVSYGIVISQHIFQNILFIFSRYEIACEFQMFL